MINHGRTLLLNRPGRNRPPPTYFLEEYVPVEFAKLILPGGLSIVQAKLIPIGSDDAFANLLMHAYMQLLHSTDLAQDLLALDPRFTYDLDRSAVGVPPDTSYRALTASTQLLPLVFSGTVTASRKVPQLYTNWGLYVTDTWQVTAMRLRDRATKVTTVTITDGATSPIDLPGQSDYKVCITQAAGGLPLDGQWSIQTFVVPHVDCSEILADVDRMGSEAQVALFPNTEPYLTYRKMWTDHVYPAYRLGGVLMAFIRRAEEVRTRAR